MIPSSAFPLPLPFDKSFLLVHGFLGAWDIFQMCFLKISLSFGYYCLRDKSLKLSSSIDLLLRRSFLCRCWYQTTPPRARATRRRITLMAIKKEDRISASFIGIFMPSSFTLSSPMSLRITAEMEEEERDTQT